MSEYDYAELPAQEALELAQEVAITRHPEAAPFRDLLSGPNLQAIESLAEDIAKRVKAGQLPAADDDEPRVHQDDDHQGEAATSVATPDRVAQERENLRRNPGGDWSAYLAAKYTEAGVA
jgi:hypothetical protein